MSVAERRIPVGVFIYLCVCVCVCESCFVFIRASLPHACHSSVSMRPCLTASSYCVCREPRTHSGISAPHRNPLESVLVSSDTQTIRIHCAEPYPVFIKLESHETELCPGLALHPAPPSCAPESQSSPVSVSHFSPTDHL